VSEPALPMNCRNCGKEFPEDFQFCPHCGQKNEDSIMSFKDMFFDTLSAFFAFDTKAIRSIPRLIFQPGSLTLEYIRGKRETYLAPFRLYLFVSIVLFLVLPFVLSEDMIFKSDLNPGDLISDSITAEIKTDLMKDTIIARDLAIADTFLSDNIPGKFNFSLFSLSTDDSSTTSGWGKAVSLVRAGQTPKAAVDSSFTETSTLNKLLLRQGLKIQTQNGKGLLKEFLDKTSYALFLFLPAFALLLKLLYIRRKRFYIEHLIFSIHFFSFLFLILLVYIILVGIFHFLPIWPVFVLALIYLYAAMFRVYGQSWLKTGFKWIALTFTTAAFFLPFFFVFVLLISLIFY
jgi:hypothetical protein